MTNRVVDEWDEMTSFVRLRQQGVLPSEMLESIVQRMNEIYHRIQDGVNASLNETLQAIRGRVVDLTGELREIGMLEAADSLEQLEKVLTVLSSRQKDRKELQEQVEKAKKEVKIRRQNRQELLKTHDYFLHQLHSEEAAQSQLNQSLNTLGKKLIHHYSGMRPMSRSTPNSRIENKPRPSNP